jgi:hypothetical protein
MNKVQLVGGSVSRISGCNTGSQRFGANRQTEIDHQMAWPSDQYIRILVEQWFGHGFSKKHTISQELEDGLWRGPVLETNIITYVSSKLQPTQTAIMEVAEEQQQHKINNSYSNYNRQWVWQVATTYSDIHLLSNTSGDAHGSNSTWLCDTNELIVGSISCVNQKLRNLTTTTAPPIHQTSSH